MESSKSKDISGILNINKPAGITSFGVVAKLRRKLGVKRVGHCGTLDPSATGVLLVCFGKATKKSACFSAQPKTYRGVIKFGVSTDTDDLSGKVVAEKNAAFLTLDKIKNEALKFTGKISQKVPAYSAVKHKGRCLYDYARKGIKVEQPVKIIEIEYFDIKSFSPPLAEFEMRCSSGSYVRAVARDMGEGLGCGALLAQLERTRSGHFRVEDSLELERVLELPVEDLIGKAMRMEELSIRG